MKLQPQDKLNLMRTAQKDIGLAILELHGHLEKQMEDKISREEGNKVYKDLFPEIKYPKK